MNLHANRKFSGVSAPYRSGFTLLDVLLAILIFVVGMLALASLQGNLTRSSSDANARTVATNIAEELIEEFRTFEQVESEAGKDAFQDIVGQTLTVSRAGNDFTVVVSVDDYYFLPDGESVTSDTGALPEDRDTSVADFKFVELAVSWVGNEFQIGDGTVTEGRLGSGQFTLASIVPPVSSFGSAKVAAEDDDAAGTPPVSYVPGQAPETVSINLGNSKYKESTKPEPIVWRSDELIETWFDVITYRKVGDEAIFQRREEFVAISCVCDLQGSSSVGRLPTIWDGAEYIEGEFVEKTTGVVSDSAGRQSQYCEVCCRDHHDTGSGPGSYRPWAADFSGDHPHYNRDTDGNLAEVTGVGGDVTYLEACRLVRKDGFFRVAQDFNLHEINAFPENYPMVSWDVREYSNYVNSVAEAEFGAAASPAVASEALSFEGRNVDNPSLVPPSNGNNAPGQQLRSRGIYFDTKTSALEQTIEDCFVYRNDDCKAPEADSALELYPFFDVQLTHLARWSETQPNNPVEITNEEISNQGYSRGKASKAGDMQGRSIGHTVIETGNAGLISLLPVTASPVAENKISNLYLQAADGTEMPPPNPYPTITGTISAAGGTADATIVTLTPSAGVECFKPTNETFVCIIGPDAAGTNPTLTVSNYGNRNKDLFIASDLSTVGCLNYVDYSALDPLLYPEPAINYNYTVFSLPTVDTSGVSLVINAGLCP
jgi:type II secretory pathway pseudopilin PulG